MSAFSCEKPKILLDPNLAQQINNHISNEANKLTPGCVTPKKLDTGEKAVSWKTQFNYNGATVSSYVENGFVLGDLNGNDTYTLITSNCKINSPSTIPATFTCTQVSSQDVTEDFKEYSVRLKKLRDSF